MSEGTRAEITQLREQVDVLCAACLTATTNDTALVEVINVLHRRLLQQEANGATYRQAILEQQAQIEALALIQRAGRKAADVAPAPVVPSVEPPKPLLLSFTPVANVPYNPAAQLPSAISPFTLGRAPRPQIPGVDIQL